MEQALAKREDEEGRKQFRLAKKMLKFIEGLPEPEAGQKHPCVAGCKRYYMANKVLIDLPDELTAYDWQGAPAAQAQQRPAVSR